jgi:arginase
MARFVIVPQWQGSSSSRAMQLVDGATAIAGDLPQSACTFVEVPAEAGESLDTGVRRLSTLLRVRELVQDAVAGGDDPAIVIGGDCGVSVGAVAAIAADDVALVWLDAHADLHTPDTVVSGAFHGMALRAILGEGVDGMTLPVGSITPDRVVLVGTRDLAAPEEDYAAQTGIRMLEVESLADPASVVAAVAETGASRVFLHIDVDVLDPAAITGLAFPVPFGAQPADLVATIKALRARFPLAGAAITEFSPSSPDDAVDDMGTILRIVGALA